MRYRKGQVHGRIVHGRIGQVHGVGIGQVHGVGIGTQGRHMFDSSYAQTITLISLYSKDDLHIYGSQHQLPTPNASER